MISKFTDLKLGAITILLGAGILSAQVKNYTFQKQQGQYKSLENATVIAKPTNAYSGSLDTNKYSVTIPFSFNFNGKAYTTMNVWAKGYISFGDKGDNTTTPIGTSQPYEGVISVFGEDILSSFNPKGLTSTIETKEETTSSGKEFVIEWKHFLFYASLTSKKEDFNFQVRLKENGTITMVYNVQNIETYRSDKEVQVGLRGKDNTDFNSLTANGTPLSNWDNTLPATTADDVIKTNKGKSPSQGLTFIYTPPASTLSLEESVNANNIVKISPNPVENTINIITNEALESFQVIDLSGKIVLRGDSKLTNISQLPKGVYIVKINIKGGKVISQKIIKK